MAAAAAAAAAAPQHDVIVIESSSSDLPSGGASRAGSGELGAVGAAVAPEASDLDSCMATTAGGGSGGSSSTNLDGMGSASRSPSPTPSGVPPAASDPAASAPPPSGGSRLEMVFCHRIDSYVRVKRNTNQLCWKWRKVEA